MEIASIIVGIIGILISIGSAAANEITSAAGNDTAGKLTRVAKNIYDKISKNSDLLNKLTDAYNSKNNSLVTELLQGAGFGPRSEAIKRAIKDLGTEFNQNRAKVQKQVADLTNQYNEVTTAANKAGTTIANTMYADETYNKFKSEDSESSVDQLVNGGAN